MHSNCPFLPFFTPQTRVTTFTSFHFEFFTSLNNNAYVIILINQLAVDSSLTSSWNRRSSLTPSYHFSVFIQVFHESQHLDYNVSYYSNLDLYF